MCSFLKYQIDIMPTICFVSLGFASGTKNMQGIIPTFDSFKTFYSIKKCNIYRLNVLSFTLGIQNVFVIEASN